MSIAEKLRAKAATSGKVRSSRAGDATQQALSETIQKDDIRRGGGWEQFDLNRMNYEVETKDAMMSATRKSVVAAIESDSMCITDQIDADEYHKHSKSSVSAEDERHMANIFGATKGGQAPKDQRGKAAPSRSKVAPNPPPVAQDARDDTFEGLDLDGAIVEGYSEDVSDTGGAAGATGPGESWKDRIKKAQLAEKIAADRRMQRLAAAHATPDVPSSHSSLSGQAQDRDTGQSACERGGGGDARDRAVDTVNRHSAEPARPKMSFSFIKK
jgi:hypothetical protein